MNKPSLPSSQSLVKLGLSPHETVAYQVLLEEGSLSAKELAKRANILPNAAYRLLEKLTERSFVSPIKRYPKIYRALSPSIALETLSKSKILEIENLKDKAVEELSKKGAKIQQTQVNLLNSKYETFMAYAEMAKNAKEEILLISIGEAIPEEIILANRDALEKGVKIRMIAHKYDNENQELLKSWVKMGMEIRHYPDWGFHMGIMDAKNSFLSVNNPKDTRERMGIRFFSEGLSKALRDYFYSVWEKAIKVT